MNKQIIYNDEARLALQRGIDTVANAVKITLGPRGQTVIIHNDNGLPICTKDGVTVANNITSVEDPYENLGVQLCKEIAKATNNVCGDGTTGATTIAQALTSESLRHLSFSNNLLGIKRGIDLGLEKALELIDNVAQKITTKEQVEMIANISANDASIGEIVAEAIEAVGDGIITLEESRDTETKFKITDGFSYSQGYISPYLITDASKNITEYQNIKILLIDHNVKTFQSLVPALERVKQDPILIIAESFSQDAINGIIINKVKGLAFVATKTPGFGEKQKSELLQDICACTGGKVFNETIGHKYDEIDDEFFGFARKVIITQSETTILEGRRNEQAVSDRVELLRSMLESEESDYNKELLNNRIAKLNDGVGVISIFAPTEIALKELKDRFTDSLGASRCAMQEGIVQGGGICLLQIAEILEENVEIDAREVDMLIGLRILIASMKSTFKQICLNGGFSYEVISRQILNSKDESIGFDAKYGEICDSFERGIIDPAKVIKHQLLNATSIIGLVLTSSALIVPVLDKNEKFLMADPSF